MTHRGLCKCTVWSSLQLSSLRWQLSYLITWLLMMSLFVCIMQKNKSYFAYLECVQVGEFHTWSHVDCVFSVYLLCNIMARVLIHPNNIFQHFCCSPMCQSGSVSRHWISDFNLMCWKVLISNTIFHTGNRGSFIDGAGGGGSEFLCVCWRGHTLSIDISILRKSHIESFLVFNLEI